MPTSAFAFSKPQRTPLETSEFERYQPDPVGFARDVLKCEPWGKQREILEALAAPSARVSVRSSNGVGKTWLAAAATLWFLYSFRPCRVITTATKRDQVRNALWPEIRRAHARAGLNPEPDVLQLRIDDEQFAIGQTANSATAFQGLHAPHVLVVVDEGAGIEDHIWEGVDAVRTNEDARELVIGNPTSSSGRFYDSHHLLRSLYRTFSISAFDSPNFTGEEVSEEARRALVSQAWVADQKEAWGEESPLYAARVLGEFPDQAEGALIALSWIEAASRDLEPLGPARMGLDVARQGNCENVAYIVKGSRIVHMEAWHSDDLMYTAGRTAALIKQHDVIGCNIDATGMGAGVLDRLKEQELPVHGVWVGQQAKELEKFLLLRDELAWNLRERFRAGDIGGLTDSKTQAQCSAIQFAFDSRGRIKVESKVDMSERGLPSPDRFDALALAFYQTRTERPRSSFGKAGGWM